MDLLRKRYDGKSTAVFDANKKSWVLRIPQNFSFIKNPDETLHTIYSLVEISKNSENCAIHFDHSKLLEMDMGASAVLDVIAFNLRSEWGKRNLKCDMGGILPEDEKMKQILMTMGITRNLNVKGVKPSDEAEQLIKKFPLYRGYKQERSELGGPQHEQQAQIHLMKYLDECLASMSDYEFSTEGRRQISKWAGEIITNAEEHSGNNQWFVLGCMAPCLAKDAELNDEDKNCVIGECQLSIFGFGDSIYQTLSSDKTSQETRDQIEELVRKHTGFFGSFHRYSKEDLWTLYALQDGVSRFSPTPGENTRGKGTVEMIEAFQNFKAVDKSFVTEMSVISGSTCIHFNDNYHLKAESVLGGTRKIIAFNAQNNLEHKPDSRHVYSLSGHFPGTLLTIKFFIDNRYLEKIHKSRPVAQEQHETI